MKKTLIILSLVLLAACGLSRDEKQNIAINACSIMGETKKSEAVIRLQTMSDAREKIGGETYIRGDDAIIEAFELGLCQQLVMNEDYEWYRNVARNELRKRERVAAEKLAEEQRAAAEKQRIADSKPTVKEEFFSNGQLKSRTNYQPKSDGGKEHGLSIVYWENTQLKREGNYKDGKKEGLWEEYRRDGLISSRTNFKDGKKEGLEEIYRDDLLQLIYNYKGGKKEELFEKYEYEDGKQFWYEQGNYKDGKRYGLWKYRAQDDNNISLSCYDKWGRKISMMSMCY